MKKILPIFFILAIIFNFIGCINTAANNENTLSETYSKNSSTDEYNKSQTESTKESTLVKEIITINIIVGDTTFAATLEDNDTAKAFIKQLPLTVDMSELNGNEKYNYLSNNIRSDTSSCPGTINEGDLMLYDKTVLLFFYKMHNTSYNYVKIGHIENTKGLAKAVGSGSVKVTFSISE